MSHIKVGKSKKQLLNSKKKPHQINRNNKKNKYTDIISHEFSKFENSIFDNIFNF